MKEYYSNRFRWIFNYTRQDFGYRLLKTLCVIFGLPIYAISFVLEMVLTAVNMILSWIPIFGVLVTVICKSLVWLVGRTFYLNVLTDLKAYEEVYPVQLEEGVDEPDSEASEENPEEQNTEKQETDGNE